MGVPGPTRVTSSFSSRESMTPSPDTALGSPAQRSVPPGHPSLFCLLSTRHAYRLNPETAASGSGHNASPYRDASPAIKMLAAVHGSRNRPLMQHPQAMPE